ncbi:MAG: ATP-binding protein [Bacteroidota bacterium]
MKAFIYWSGGKDAAMALHVFVQQYGVLPQLLLCRTSPEGTVAAHEVPAALIKGQAKSLNIPVKIIELPSFAPNTVYEETMGVVLRQLVAEGFTHAIFGDIFLEELKAYHQTMHKRYGIACVFPLWGKPTDLLCYEIIDKGVETIVTSVNRTHLEANFAGMLYNKECITLLPQGIDKCGENGEFHTFVFNAPLFSEPVKIKKGNHDAVTYHSGTAYETTMAFIRLEVGE